MLAKLFWGFVFFGFVCLNLGFFLFVFCYLVVNLKVNSSNALGREMVSPVFPDRYLYFLSNSTLSQVV